jgi:hypothetical protein
MQTWETHFKGVLQVRETRPNETHLELCTDINQELFTIEVEKAFKELKNRKTCGPGQIYNEHFKDTTPALKGVWTNLFNECLKQGKIPDAWQLATLEVPYKEKGEVSDPKAYRRIALECTAFKLVVHPNQETLYDD